MSRPRTRWVMVAIVTTLLAALFGYLFMPRPVAVDASRLVIGPIAETVQDQGATRVREAYVVAAPVSGRLDRISLKVGDRVLAGKTIIARLHPAASEMLDPRARALAEAAVNAARAAVASARANRDRLMEADRHADVTLARMRKAVEEGLVSKQSLDDAIATSGEANAAVEAASAELEARDAQLASAQAVLAEPRSATFQTVSVQSPATGYVTHIMQPSERVVAKGEPILEIGESGGLEAQIEFLSQDAVRITEGMPAEVYGWGGASLPATVRRVEPKGFAKTSALGVEEHRVLVMLQVKDPPDVWTRMGPGYGVWGRVFLRRESAALKTSLGALVGTGDGWGVFRIEDGRAHLVPVLVGAMTDTEVEIRGGLRPGDEVVVFPSDKVRDGVAVSVRPKG